MPAGALARTPTHRPAITRRRIASRRRTSRRRLASVFLQSLRVSRPGHPFSVAPHHVHNYAAEAKPARGPDGDIFAAGGIVAHCRSGEYACFQRSILLSRAAIRAAQSSQMRPVRTTKRADGDRPQIRLADPSVINQQYSRLTKACSVVARLDFTGTGYWGFPDAGCHHRPPSCIALPSAGRRSLRDSPPSSSAPAPGRNYRAHAHP